MLTSQAQAGTPARLLPQAQEVLAAVGREERETRQKLTVLETQEEQLGLEIRRAMAPAAMGPHTIEGARKRLAELGRRREDLARQKAEQWRLMRGIRERLHAARRTYEELNRHAEELHHTIRREERTVGQWQRQIKDTEEQLARWQRLLAEAQARLEQAQLELGELGAPPAFRQ